MAIKVCHMTSTHKPKDQRIFYKECVSLTKAGYEVYLVEQGGSETDCGVHIAGTGEQNDGKYYRYLRRPQAVYRLARQIDADIYHFHDVELIPIGLKLKRQGKIVIFDSHEDYRLHIRTTKMIPGPQWVRELAGRVYGKYEDRALKCFDAAIYVTYGPIRERFTALCPKTAMITNYPLVEGEWRTEPAYDPQSDYVAFAGQVSDVYKPDQIAQAVQNIPGLKFKICGPTSGEAILDKVKAADPGNKVEYLGVKKYFEVPGFLRKSRAGFVLGDYEWAGGKEGTLGNNKLFEMMMCGIPVICTGFDLWKDVVEKNHCGICVEPNDTEQLHRAVEYLWTHPAEAEQMGRRGRQAALETYNWTTQEAVLLDLYDALVREKLQ